MWVFYTFILEFDPNKSRKNTTKIKNRNCKTIKQFKFWEVEKILISM